MTAAAVAMPFEANNVLYIKLGEGGIWEDEAFADGVLRFGYRDLPHAPCAAGDWDEVLEHLRGWGTSAGATTNHLRQVRQFYESGPETVFITFSGGMMHWCRPWGEVIARADNSKVRSTVDGWHSQTLGGVKLYDERIAGHVRTAAMYRATICSTDTNYVLRKISDRPSPEAAAAAAARTAYAEAILALIRQLGWRDFELLVELLFTTSGWRRVSATGGTQKSTDMDLVLPSTNERAFVQVKSRTDAAQLLDYIKEKDKGSYSRLFFAWHQGEAIDYERADITLIDPVSLAERVVDAGLAQWVVQRLS